MSRLGGSQGAGEPIRVGLAGLGRSGWDIHAPLLSRLANRYQIVAVLDQDANRRKEAEERYDCRAYSAFPDLLGDRAVELVIVGMPSHLHAAYSIEALAADKHVVCEKPMATSSKDAARMVAASDATKRILTVFHNRRYDPDFQKIRGVIASGVLGRIVEIRMAATKFSRRWDWQTQTRYGGGELNNTGSHLIDLALQLFGEQVPTVFCHRERALTLGDAEDHVKIVLTADGAPTIDVEISSVHAYPSETWHISGTQGGLTGTHHALRWKSLDPTGLPARDLDDSLSADRTYNQDQPEWHEEYWESETRFPAHHIGFYIDLYDTIRNDMPLVITPRSVQRVVDLIEACRESSPLTGPKEAG